MFYRTDEANDNKDIIEFMKSASPSQILSRTDYWGEDLAYLLPSIEKHIGNIEKNGIRAAMQEVL